MIKTQYRRIYDRPSPSVQRWIRHELAEIKVPSKLGEFATYDGATQMARRIQGFWNGRDGYGWVKCWVEKMLGLDEVLHDVIGHTGAYAVRSNMVYLSGGRGPVEFKALEKPAKKTRGLGAKTLEKQRLAAALTDFSNG